MAKRKRYPPGVAATADELDQLVGVVVEHAETLVADHPEAVPPQLFVLARDALNGPLTLIGMALFGPFNAAGAKQAAMVDAARALFLMKLAPVGAALLTEAWTAEYSEDDWNRPDAPAPDKRLDRKECLVVMAQSCDREINRGAEIPLYREDGKMYARPVERIPPPEYCGLLDCFYLGFLAASRRASQGGER
jgi:hypothetical protein